MPGRRKPQVVDATWNAAWYAMMHPHAPPSFQCAWHMATNQTFQPSLKITWLKAFIAAVWIKPHQIAWDVPQQDSPVCASEFAARASQEAWWHPHVSFSRERLRRVLRKKAAVVIHLHTLTSADLHLHTFTSADLHLHTFTSADLHLHTFTSADLHLHTFKSADLHSTSSHLHICCSTSSHLHICSSTSSHLHIFRSASSHLHICRSSHPPLYYQFFFLGVQYFLFKNTIFQKSSRQWVRVPGHDMGPGIKYHTKKGPDFFSWKLPDVQRQEINFCLLWLRGGWYISLCI